MVFCLQAHGIRHQLFDNPEAQTIIDELLTIANGRQDRRTSGRYPELPLIPRTVQAGVEITLFPESAPSDNTVDILNEMCENSGWNPSARLLTMDVRRGSAHDNNQLPKSLFTAGFKYIEVAAAMSYAIATTNNTDTTKNYIRSEQTLLYRWKAL